METWINKETHRAYCWNEHGVCTNADKIKLSASNCEVVIETALRDGLWYYGFEYNDDNYHNYRGVPCSYNHQKGYTCKRCAITQAISHCMKCEKPRGEMLRKLQELYFEKAQLLLF